MKRSVRTTLAAVTIAATPVVSTTALGQEGVIVYRLGRDTVAVDGKPLANTPSEYRFTFGAYAGFAQGPIFINYGSPAVRGRTVWGGVLIPIDTIWRTGANEATHLATSKTIQLGDMTLAPGLYTLWTQHTASGTWLIVNKQVGQWGTGYNATNDIGRVQMQLAPTPDHVEDFTIAVRSLGGPRGAIDLAWGDKVATASFTLKQ